MGRDIDGALAAYDMALRLDPRNSVAMTGLAFIWREKGELDRAIAVFSEALRIDPRNPKALMGRAIGRGEKGDLDNALADASEAIRLYPNWSQLYSERGVIWRSKGDLEHALHDQNRAVEIGGDTQRAAEYNFSARGDTYRYLGEFDRALADYDGALKLRPGYIPAYTGRGLTFEKMGDLVRAKTEFEKALNSTTLLESDFSRSGVDTARAHVAALDSGIAPPSIPAAPEKAASVTSIPTPKAVVPASLPTAHAKQGRRVALVIGNSTYRNVPALTNPERDAGVVAASLRAIGFDTVTVETNNTREKMVDALRNFASEADKADWAMVYYAGHGIEMGGVNYLIPSMPGSRPTATCSSRQFPSIRSWPRSMGRGS
jgi:tetratricopeptide (TPR) repeat protein